MELYKHCPLNCREAFVTFEAPKVTQKAFSRNASFALDLNPANRAKPGLQSFCPTSFALALTSAKICYALPTLLVTIVLPDFTRSSSADKKKNIKLEVKMRAKACQKSGPGRMACSVEAFFWLDFLVTFGSSQK